MRIDPRRAALCTAVLAVLALPLLPVPEFLVTQMNYIGIDALVVLGLVLLTGVGGLTSFGQAAFVGIGAYTTAYLSTALGISPWLGLAAGLAATLVVSLVLGAITLRMSGYNLPLTTIAWCVALYYFVGNLESLGRYDGIVSIPPLTIGGTSLQSGRLFYYVVWGCAGLAALGAFRLLDSRTGRVLRAMNAEHGGGSTMPEAMGASVYRHKLFVFVLAALLASFAGWLFAHLQRTVNPSPFGITRSLDYVFMAVLGGVGHVWGAFLGSGITTLLRDVLQEWLPRLVGRSGSHELVVFGLLLIVMLKIAPGGLWAFAERVLPRRARPRDWGDAERLPARPRRTVDGPLLEVRGVRKAFGGLAAVDGVGFTVAPGEIVGLIGPNGAGKSTTFNLVSGVLSPDAGEIRLAGARIDGLPSRDIARMGLSRTFQHVKIAPDMSVLENVALGCQLRTRAGPLAALFGTDRREERQVFAEAERQLARVGLDRVGDQAAGSLSLGAQRLLEIARALASDPMLLLLDEPAAGLRHAEKRALAAVLGQLQTEGLCLLLVEHDMDFVMSLADRIVVMESGRLLLEGTPAEVQASPRVRAAYLGEAH